MPNPMTLVLFGATGDLARSKLWPALHDLAATGRLPEELAVLGVSRSPATEELRELAAEHGLRELSMGTSQDYRVAAEEGATIVRIGTSLYE